MHADSSLFARIIAHDLRSPIVTAHEALRLAEDADTSKALRLRTIASRSLQHAERMVSGLRSFVRADGQMAPVTMIDMNSLLRDVIESVELGCSTSHCQIRIDSDLGKIRSIEAHLSHVFRNLIVNAIQHNRNVDELVVRIGRRDLRQTTFYVRDNGRGISGRDQEEVFLPFRKSQGEDCEGLGLGLSLVRSLVHQLGGRVWLESDANAGSTFWFTTSPD